MRSFSFQMLPLLYIADSFISLPVTNSVNIVSEVVVWSSLQDRFQSTTISDTFHSLYLPFLHKLPLYPLVQNRVFTEQGSTNNSLLSSKGSSGSVGIFYLLLSPCLSYYLHSERHLLDLAVTPEIKSSAHLHQAHTATTIDSASPFISSISSFYCNTYKDQENLVLEALMQRLFKTIGTKMVKCANTSFSSPAQSNGGLYENILHFDCVEVTELVNELARHIAVVEEFHANSFKHTALPRITEDTDEDKEGKSDRASSKFALLDLDESSSGGSSDNEEGEQDRGNKTSGKSDEGEDYFHDVKESNHREGDAIGLNENENENEEKDSLSTKILQNLKQVRGKHQALFHPSRAAQSSSSALSSTHQQNLNMKMSPLHLLTLLSSSKGISSAPTSPTSPTSASYDKIAMQLLHVILSILKHPPNTTPSGKNAVSVSGASSRFQHYPYISNNSTSSGNSNQAPESTAVTSTNGSNNLSVDLAQRILTLYYRHRGVRQVHKLPEIAFLATTPFYKYIDMWEVKIVNELNELQDSAVLGRHLYKPLPTTTSSGKSDYDQVIANIYFLNNAATASTASRSMRRNSSADMELKERQVFELQSFLSLWHFLE